ncbi:hypothetical protein N836_10610 [Leptolyngbya sp. Heron Island J]|uniref:hypothetical protein n=1 Tax=Leptolyngbya sp. Heron Island J TaxID=1385935 RepID=UPI0003B9C48F|nr:hypothetical protein [Leptolyngbya sp. Heron Island J]ESA35709.1 hypothetical protein N836_10610 [Leptolyngbya sp. Heron Island J]
MGSDYSIKEQGEQALTALSRGEGRGRQGSKRLSPQGMMRLLGGCGLFLLAACQSGPPSPRTITIQQTWDLQVGNQVGDYRISSGLGDITLELGGDSVHMPFAGKVQPMDEYCVALTSPEVPAYLFRLCGINRPSLGQRSQGEAIGRAQQLVFAAFRKEPDGTWALVEPATDLIQQFLAE